MRTIYVLHARASLLFLVIAEHGGEICEILQRQGSWPRTVSLIHLFTFSLIVARDRVPDLLEQGHRLGLRPYRQLVFVNRQGAERA